MNIIRNLPGLWVIARNLLKSHPCVKVLAEYRAEGDVAMEQETLHTSCTWFAREIARGLDVHFHIVHPENLPAKGPVVFISNHQSYADILTYLYISHHQVGFIAKEELRKVPVISDWNTRLRGLFMQRGDVRASLATINEGVSYLKQGFSLVIFPEGTRSHGPDMAPFKPGSLKLAIKARVPIVPITLDGTYRIFEERNVITKGCTVDVLVHPPIDTAPMNRQALVELPAQVEEMVRGGLDILRSGAADTADSMNLADGSAHAAAKRDGAPDGDDVRIEASAGAPTGTGEAAGGMDTGDGGAPGAGSAAGPAGQDAAR